MVTRTRTLTLPGHEVITAKLTTADPPPTFPSIGPVRSPCSPAKNKLAHLFGLKPS
jgi:hypothetical protein